MKPFQFFSSYCEWSPLCTKGFLLSHLLGNLLHMALYLILYYGLVLFPLVIYKFLSTYVLFPSLELEFKGRKCFSHLSIPSDLFGVWREFIHVWINISDGNDVFLKKKNASYWMVGTTLLISLHSQSKRYWINVPVNWSTDWQENNNRDWLLSTYKLTSLGVLLSFYVLVLMNHIYFYKYDWKAKYIIHLRVLN